MDPVSCHLVVGLSVVSSKVSSKFVLVMVDTTGGPYIIYLYSGV